MVALGRRIGIVAAVVMLGALTRGAMPVLGTPAGEAGGRTTRPETIGAVLTELAGRSPEAKLGHALRDVMAEAAASDTSPAASEEHWVMVQSTRRLDLHAYADFVHQFRWPAGEEVAVLPLAADELDDIAATPEVYSIDALDLPADTAPAEPVDAERGPAPERMDPDKLALLARSAPPWSETARLRLGVLAKGTDPSDASSPDASSDGGRPEGVQGVDGLQGWHDVLDNHAAKEAWEMGYRGEGVAVAVLDYAVDFAHPDLVGTWALMPDTNPYAGWPQAFDPYAGYLAVQDKRLSEAQAANRTTRTARNGMIELYQTSTVTTSELAGAGTTTACVRPLQYRSAQMPAVLGDLDCSYVLPSTSKSGTIKFGHHPDPDLRVLRTIAPGQTEWAGVLMVDEHVAGRYDTVYVDLDNDHEFSDEKPTTKEDPLSWRDLTRPPDGLPDVTGGLLYYISDGELPFPGSWVWGLENDIPAVGTVIGLLWASSDHGTLCASNIVSQGRVKVQANQILSFRDLPGGEPPSLNHGIAPASRLVSVGSVYEANRAMFAPSWRYSVFGHDLERKDDQIQITSNSYGWSEADNDGWEADGRLMDFYVRTYSPETTFLFATGNGGPGYGTLSSPKPATSIGVAASTQYGSTGRDSITDTAQITFGDVVPFSDRGPNTAGRSGPSIAADGAYASGASPINGLGDGRRAMGTWAGTSRSTPVAAGVMSLIYQAFKKQNSRWPTWSESRAILMAGARFNGYDPMVVGAGVADAADSVRIASGQYGLFAEPSEWRAGGYRGTSYEAFASIVHPGETAERRITLHNTGEQPLAVRLSAMTPRRIGSYTETVNTDLELESGPGTIPDYVYPVDKTKIPAGTQLMVVRGVLPMEQFDRDGNNAVDNGFTFGVLQHTDIDGDGRFWLDADDNGAVNYRTPGTALIQTSWDGGSREYDGSAVTFGPRITTTGISGQLAWYGAACTDAMNRVPLPLQDVAGKIAVISHGNCGSNQEALNAQRAGAIAAVIARTPTALNTAGATTGITIPVVATFRLDGVTLQYRLERGAVVTATLVPKSYARTYGIDSALPVDYRHAEIDEYEWIRFASDTVARNNWQMTVHHPLERWKSGLYVALWHATRNDLVPKSQIQLRYDFYRYEPWPWVKLSAPTLTIPGRGEAAFDARVAVPAAAAPGTLEGAIFVDFERGPGDKPIRTGGGYELPGRRTTVPVHVAVAPRYNWSGQVTMGGQGGRDADALYDNGAVRGAFNWAWRAESGDWRFFFADATPPKENTYWVLHTTWDDAKTGQADIDTRFWGPQPDQYTVAPTDPAPGAEDRVDPAWYGPYNLSLKVRSTYFNPVAGMYAYGTSTGDHDDWLMAPAAEGLHEVMLHNVRISGNTPDMPFESMLSSLTMSANKVQLYANACSTFEIKPEFPLVGGFLRAYSPVTPTLFASQPITRDATAVPSAAFKRDVDLPRGAGRFVARLAGEADDNLNVYVLYDANRDGQFAYPGELVGSAVGATSRETVTLGARPEGKYQVWVHAPTVNGSDSAFDLTVDVMSGDIWMLDTPSLNASAGKPAKIEVCPDASQLDWLGDQAEGLIVFGPVKTPSLFTVPVSWSREAPPRPTIYLPMSSQVR